MKANGREVNSERQTYAQIVCMSVKKRIFYPTLWKLLFKQNIMHVVTTENIQTTIYYNFLFTQ